MSTTICIRDETTSGDKTGELRLELPAERITVRGLIRSRVYQEVKDYNVKANRVGFFRGLVQPRETEAELNGYRFRKPRQIDWKKQFDVALETFDRKGFLILVDDREVVNLNDEIDLRPETKVSFLKLVPLVGG